jgi:teichuronic acid biosynthesis glycosyltransferase TuaG
MNKVSIIMPAYNAENYIAQSIDSVIQQSYAHWELIVVDDGSTDTTAAIVSALIQEDNRIKYYYQPNKKQAAARNLGISQSTGDWIAFLDADDLWSPDKLATQIRYIQEVEADVFYTGGYVVDENGHQLSEYSTVFGHYSGVDMYKQLYFSNPVPILSVLVKKSWVSKTGPQDENIQIAGCEDWDYWIRLAHNGASFFGIPEKLFHYRINPQGTSRKVLQMKRAECFALYKNLEITIFQPVEEVRLRVRFDKLIKQIIDLLYESQNYTLIPSYLEQLNNIKSSVKYKYAQLTYKLFGTRSRRLVNFILYH